MTEITATNTGADLPEARPANPDGQPVSPDARRALLAERLRQRSAGRHYPLSYPQQRLWFLDQLEPDSAVYLIPLAYRITGPLEVAALEHALTEVVRRHQALRTVFRPVDGVPRQFVRPPAPVPLPVRDVAGHPDPAAAAEQAVAQEARRPFDLETDLMVRPLLVRLGAADHRLCLTLHHIAADGWSLGLLGAELSACYRAFLDGTDPGLPPLPVQYPDFAEEQAARLTGEPLARMLSYWRTRLAGAPALASLPTDYPRPPTQSHAGDHVDFRIDATVTGQAGALARACGATPFAVLLAAFAALVHAYTGGGEVVVGSPVSGRTREDLHHLAGFFANTVVQRVDVSGNPSFTELVGRTRDESRAAVANQDLPFEKLVEELHPSRDPAHNPLFQLMLSYHDGGLGGLDLPGCEVVMAPGDTATAKFDLTLSITRTTDGFSARLEYATDLFAPETAAALAEQFTTLLTSAVTDPAQRLGALPVLPRAQAQRILVQWNPAPEPVPAGLVHELIEAQAARTPDAPALVAADRAPHQAMTYREVDQRASALAARLRAHGAGPDVPVGVYLDRSPDLVVTLLAVLKSGSAYLPLDPAYPWDRLAFMVRDSGAPVVVTRRSLARRLAGLPVTVLEQDSPNNLAAAEPVGSDQPSAPVSADSLAYVIYTSGSTGKPKGVMVSHRNVANFFAGMDAVLGDGGSGAPAAAGSPGAPAAAGSSGPLADGGSPGSWLAVTSMSFDISVLELLWTLARGQRVAVRGDEPRGAVAAGGPSGPAPTGPAAAGSAAAGLAPAVPAAVQARPMDFSLFYFGGDRGGDPADRYRLMIEGAKFADRNGFAAVWTPERHFHEFGGLYPNPSVTAAAIAAVTEHVAVRAGSVVLPLHDPLRVAEEWSVVDNLSGGRAGLSVASGWQPNDFVLAPGTYADRKKAMMTGLEELRHLWRGGSVRRRNGVDAETEVRVFPPPVSKELPVWVTSARSPETFQLAGQAGAGLLTHLLGHTVEQLAGKVRLYRQAWQEAGHDGSGHVTLMLHTFVGTDVDQVRETVREPLCAYIKSSFDLLSGLGQAMGSAADLRNLPETELDALVAQAFGRFFETSGLLGTPEHCADLVDQLKWAGADEVACLVDFGVGHGQVLAALADLAVAKGVSEDRRRSALADEPAAGQLRRHAVTHLQCTPSLAGVLADDPAAHAALTGLDRLLVGGEALPAPLAAQLAGLLPGDVHNMYGPTEATVWATSAKIEEDGQVTIGRPMTNVRAYVVDAYLRPTPAGAPGELLLGGLGIVRGYLGRPALTAERFIPDPFSGVPGARLYRTGDLARWLRSGELEFLGRLDHQVKLHGHRIELGEIDNVLRGHPGLRAAVTTVRGEGEHRRIVAYCVPAGERDAGLTSQAVRAFAAKVLPDYMLPADLVFLAELPMTPNGKVDRKRLPDPQRPARAGFRPPGNDTERLVAAELAGVLKTDRLGVDDNFFETGGNSLLAVQARGRLLPILGDRLSLVDIFRYPTVRGLVAALTSDTEAVGLERVREAAGRRAGGLAMQARLRRERARRADVS